MALLEKSTLLFGTTKLPGDGRGNDGELLGKKSSGVKWPELSHKPCEFDRKIVIREVNTR